MDLTPELHLLWLPARLRADVGRGVGDCLPGLAGRLWGGEVRVMPLADNLGASHAAHPAALLPLLANSCISAQPRFAQYVQCGAAWRNHGTLLPVPYSVSITCS